MLQMCIYIARELYTLDSFIPRNIMAARGTDGALVRILGRNNIDKVIQDIIFLFYFSTLLKIRW